MKAYHLCHNDYHLVKDVSPAELIANIIKLAYMKAKIASKKSEVYILDKVILSAKKILLELKSKVPKVSVLKNCSLVIKEAALDIFSGKDYELEWAIKYLNE